MAGCNPAEMMSSRNFEKYQGKWVAVPDWSRINKILASKGDFSSLSEEMKQKGHNNAIIFFVEKERVL